MGKPKEFAHAVFGVLQKVIQQPIINGFIRIADEAVTKTTVSHLEQPPVAMVTPAISAPQAATLIKQEAKNPIEEMLATFSDAFIDRIIQLPSDDQSREERLREIAKEIREIGVDEGTDLVLGWLPGHKSP